MTKPTHSTKYECPDPDCTWTGYWPRALTTSRRVDGIQEVTIVSICPQCAAKIKTD